MNQNVWTVEADAWINGFFNAIGNTCVQGPIPSCKNSGSGKAVVTKS